MHRFFHVEDDSCLLGVPRTFSLRLQLTVKPLTAGSRVSVQLNQLTENSSNHYHHYHPPAPRVCIHIVTSVRRTSKGQRMNSDTDGPGGWDALLSPGRPGAWMKSSPVAVVAMINVQTVSVQSLEAALGRCGSCRRARVMGCQPVSQG